MAAARNMVNEGDAIVLHVNGDRRYVAKAKRGRQAEMELGCML